jgi:uridine kinase
MLAYQLADIISNKIKEDEVFTIAIDGFRSSGKTELAGLLAARLKGAVIVPMADFAHDGSVHKTREEIHDLSSLEAQVLAPANSGHVSYRKNNHKDGDSELVRLDDYKILIVEGLNSLHPDIEQYFDFKIWIEAPISLTKNLGIVNDGLKENNKYWDTWAKQDVTYKTNFKPQERADFIYRLTTDYSLLVKKISEAKETIETHEFIGVNFLNNIFDYLSWIKFLKEVADNGIEWTFNVYVEPKYNYEQLQYLLFFSLLEGKNIKVKIHEVEKAPDLQVYQIDDNQFRLHFDSLSVKYNLKPLEHFSTPKVIKTLSVQDYLGRLYQAVCTENPLYIEDAVDALDDKLLEERFSELLVSFRALKKKIGFAIINWLEEYDPELLAEFKQDSYRFYNKLGVLFKTQNTHALSTLKTKQDIGVKYLHSFATSSFEDNEKLLHRLHSKTVKRA